MIKVRIIENAQSVLKSWNRGIVNLIKLNATVHIPRKKQLRRRPGNMQTEEDAAEGGNATTTLAHELQRSSNINEENLNPNRMNPIGDDPGRADRQGVKISEYRAVQFEDHVRVNTGVELRDTYDEGKDGKRTDLIIKGFNYVKGVSQLPQ